MHPTINFDKLPWEVIYDPDKWGFSEGARFGTQEMTYMLVLSVFAEGTVILHRLRKKLYEIRATERLHKDTGEVYQKKYKIRDISDIFEPLEYNGEPCQSRPR